MTMNHSGSGKPKQGMSLDEAFVTWSDPTAIAELRSLAGTMELPSLTKAGLKIADPTRAEEYVRKRHEAERAFCDLMSEGDRLLSGIREWVPGRVIMPPPEWLEKTLDVDFDIGNVASHVGTYDDSEFFEIGCIPRNIFPPYPAWLTARLNEMPKINVCKFDASYRSGAMNGTDFKLPPLCARIIASLHRERIAGGEWLDVKDVTFTAGSSETKLANVFKNVRLRDELYESRSGKCRLHPSLKIEIDE